MFTYPLFSGSGSLTVLFKFTPYRPLLPQQPFKSCKILHYSQWRFQSGITRSLQKIVARCLHLPIYFRACAIRWCHLNYSPDDPCCHGNEFWDKKWLQLGPHKKIIARCFHLSPYFLARAIRWFHLNFSPADPRCHGNEFRDKIDYNSVPQKIVARSFHLPLIFGPGLCNGVM